MASDTSDARQVQSQLSESTLETFKFLHTMNHDLGELFVVMVIDCQAASACPLHIHEDPTEVQIRQ